jgi:hypothetical protein
MRLSVAVLDQLAAGAGAPEMLAAFPRWKSIAIVDSDEDGEMDTVRIELVTGEVWVRVARALR